MNYQVHYDRLVARAQARMYSPDVYVERHHILPRCMGGTDNPLNIVKLPPEEHVTAHRLLCRIHPTVADLALAVTYLCRARIGREARRVYAMDRARHIQTMKKPRDRVTCQKIKDTLTGAKHTEERRRNISASRKGKPGHKHTKESIERIRQSNSGRIVTAEHREKLRASQLTRIAAQLNRSLNTETYGNCDQTAKTTNA
jgi:hypothetical protein